MNGTREGQVARVEDPSAPSANWPAENPTAEGAALHRLEASRALIRVAMEAHVRESTPPQDSPRGIPKSLGQRLLERARRLPVVRTALAIRDLRRD